MHARGSYDRWAEICDVEDNPLVAIDEARVREQPDGAAGLDVCDLGCGTGRQAGVGARAVRSARSHAAAAGCGIRPRRNPF